MTENSKFKRAVRDRMVATGDKYTEAARHVGGLLPADGTESVSRQVQTEPHYAFTPPATIEYVDASGRRYLPVPDEVGPAFTWGYTGTGPNTSAWAVLLDATGSCDMALAIAFTADNLDWWDEIGDQAFSIAKKHVAEWRRLNERRVRKQEAVDQTRIYSFSEMGERMLAHQAELAASGPRKPFWQAYRDQGMRGADRP